MIRAFDGHNDTLKLLEERPDRSFGSRGADGHLDLPRAREGGLVGGLFAMFASERRLAEVTAPKGDDPPAEAPMDPDEALRATLRMFAVLLRLEARGWLRVVGDVAGIERAMADDVLAAVPHFEGAEAIPADLEALSVFHRLGLRSLGLTWSRPNAFAHGVAPGFPRDPDRGPGLTAHGRALVAACDRWRILLDVSHLNARGFWEVLRIGERPVVASHSNAHALSPSPRNLTDDQLDALAERDGLVGATFACSFLRDDGRGDADTPLDAVARHLEHLISRLGEDRVGIGSDFDGTTVPAELGDAAGLPRLWNALRARGFDDDLLERIAHRNWLALLRRVWGA